MKTKDGLGQDLRPDGLYYVQDAREPGGDCVLWWCPERNGYTTILDEAGVYTGEQVARLHRDTDIPWPKEQVESMAVQVVRAEKLIRLRDGELELVPSPLSVVATGDLLEVGELELGQAGVVLDLIGDGRTHRATIGMPRELVARLAGRIYGRVRVTLEAWEPEEEDLVD